MIRHRNTRALNGRWKFERTPKRSALQIQSDTQRSVDSLHGICRKRAALTQQARPGDGTNLPTQQHGVESQTTLTS